MNKSQSTLQMVQAALLTALIFVLAFVPNIGYVRIPILAIQATTVHIPVIIGSIVLGPKRGAFLGGCFGLTSLINNTISPSITSFVFSPFIGSADGIGGNPLSLVICFVPRILVGIVPYFVFKGLKSLSKKDGKLSTSVALMIAGIAGSLTNTILVMSMIYLFFGHEWAQAKEIAYDTVLKIIGSVVAINGTIEALVAAILSSAICAALFKIIKQPAQEQN